MSDLVSRTGALNLVRDVCDAIMSTCESHYDEETEDAVYDDMREVDAILKCNKEIRIALANMPSAQQWIPVSERLPEPNEMVLISVNGEVDADWIAVDNTGYGCWYRTMRHAIDIDAWMPLPEPYKGDRDEPT